MFSVRQPLPLLLAARRTLADPDFLVLARTIVMMGGGVASDIYFGRAQQSTRHAGPIDP